MAFDMNDNTGLLRTRLDALSWLTLLMTIVISGIVNQCHTNDVMKEVRALRTDLAAQECPVEPTVTPSVEETMP
jgi:hypothetical protein